MEADGSVHSIIIEKGQNIISKNTAEVKEMLGEINEIEKRIDEKEETLKNWMNNSFFI